ncbi:alpha/beta hydrolase [Streptomyces sp. 8N616]|uniref:alpha/beta hydrolase n=1 Tax=Streptomyces sp. 8N616 TaxID=3457414 RepID=UPI003FD23540
MAPMASATGTDPEGLYEFPRSRADNGARVTGVERLDERTADLSIASPSLGDGVPVRVILPRSWSPDSKRRYPTVYLLQGASDDYTSWTRETDVEELASDADVIVVTPEGGRAGFYSNWWNHGRKGGPQWETFHTAELPQILERGYRANRHRAVIGISEGGLGALNYAAHHRGTYDFAGSFSGVVDTADQALRWGIYLTCMREGEDPVRLWGDPERNQDVWDAHNPSKQADRLRGTKVHLSSAAGMPGSLDKGYDPTAGFFLEGPVYRPNVRFADQLRAAGVDVTANFYPSGSHAWPYWERELHVAWPSVLAALGVAP